MPTEIDSLHWAALFSGALILVLVALSIHVVIGRNKHRVLLGDGGNAAMSVASRSFGNAAEYIPAGIAAIILLAQLGYAPWAIQLVGGLMLAGRIIHPFGLKATGGVHPLRVAGMALTWTSLITGAVMLVICPFL